MLFCPFIRRFRRILALLAALLLAGGAHAAPVSRQQALDAASAWLSLSPDAMGKPHGRLAGTATTVKDSTGQPEFYAVDLAPQGFVVIAADDAVEPVIAFSTTDNFQAVPGHPLYDLLRTDLPARIFRARASHAGTRDKWTKLRALAAAPKPQATGGNAPGASVSSVDDVRVAPFVQSTWNQLTSYNLPVYNYYTPPHAAGNVNNYYTGCVATMLGQIMRFYQWPQTGVGTGSFQIQVGNSSENRSLRGGDGAGGAYAWDQMPLSPSQSISVTQQQAIGALLADAGVASNMDYDSNGSSAYISATVLTKTFHYANAELTYSALSEVEVALQANLDAGMPVGLGIYDGNEGHAVVADGYGYDDSTLYHHLNLGWSGAFDAWYNLPTIDAGGYDFNVIDGALYNIDPSVKGEVISGRIVDNLGNPVVGATVSITDGGPVLTATTNAEGIYAQKGLASNTKYTLTASGGTYHFSPSQLSVTTGQSTQDGGAPGDKSGLDFSATAFTGSVSVQLDSGAAASGGEWRVNGGLWSASGANVGGVPIGTGTLSFRGTKDWIAPADQLVSVALNQTTSVQVDFSPVYSLTATADNAAYGQVSVNPPSTDQGSYPKGNHVTVTATPNSGYYFAGWIDNGMLVSTDGTFTLAVTGTENLVADFPPDSLTGENTQDYVTSDHTADTIDVLADIADSSGTPTVLSVTQPDNGTVTINGDGTLSFTPGSKFHGSTQFSYTVSDGNGGTLTQLVTISNWFAASVGTYSGLSLASDVTNETSGYLKVTVGASGAFSGKLKQAGFAYPLAGTFDGNANYLTTITQKDGTESSLSIHLEPATEITGTVTTGGTSSQVIAERETFGSSNKAPEAGKYVALFAGNGSVPGNGYLRVSVNSAGTTTLSGRLADGTPISAGGYLNSDGSLDYYAGIYASGTSAGSLFGAMVFAPANTVQCTGTYAWFRPASTAADYPAGFAQAGGVTGALAPNPASHNGQGAGATSIAAELSSGDLTAPIDESGQLFSNGKITWTAQGSENLTLKVGATGSVSGSFIDPSTGKTVHVLGLWMPGQSLGGGFFLSGTSAGALSLGP
jgi:hypothetical protein